MERSIVDLVDYSRQEGLEDNLFHELSQTRLIIIGCGGIGFWVGIQAAMFGVNEFVLIDGDKIEHSNLNRLPVPQTWVGVNKAVALRKLIRFLRPFTAVNVLARHMTNEKISLLNNMNSNDVPWERTQTYIVDTTDDARIQKAISDAVLADTVDVAGYIKIGYEGLKVGFYDNMQVWIPDDYRPGYRTAQSNVFSSAIAGGLGLLKLLLNFKGDIGLELNKLLEPPKERVKDGKK